MAHRLLSTGASLSWFLCLLAGCCIASCCAASNLHHLLLYNCLLCPSLTLCLHQLVVASNFVALPLLLDAPLAHLLPPATPLPPIHQLALSCTAILVTPSFDAAAIAGVLKCTANPPGSGIANGHCPLLLGSHPPTCPPAPLHCPLCFH